MRFKLTTIHVNNLEESIEFYTEFMEMKEVRRFSPNKRMTIVFLDDGAGGIIELIKNEQEVEPPGDFISIGFVVDNMENIHDKAKKMGVEIIRQPKKLPSGVTLFFVRDPAGVVVEFIEGFNL
ncbi:MAG: VOC family protein [Deltaproteobacteria bacterium]|jgi:lactoylglutathione lyase|nr:VOC family protein [Deltaproteobacteria bacterium]